MSKNMQFILPQKIDSLLATLNRLYEKSNELLLQELVVNTDVTIDEEWEYDNWNGGIYGHAVNLKVSIELYLKIVNNIIDIQSRLTKDINKLYTSKNEHVCNIFILMEDNSDIDNWRQDTGLYHPPQAAKPISSIVQQRIWDTGSVRVFLSHKSLVKVETKQLKDALALYGIAAFVAHEDIEPTEEWHQEIERALFSMDALVALLTPDFHDSNWTDQEVGIAMGRGVPTILIRLGKDPYGLMGKWQGLGGCTITDSANMAIEIFRLLYKKLPDKSKLFDCAVSTYAESGSFAESGWNVEHLLTVFETVTADQLQRLLVAYNENNQNTNSFKGKELLKPLLEKWTGKNWTTHRNKLVLEIVDADTEIPF